MNIKGKALLAGCIALAFSNMALAEDIKVAVVGAMSGPVAQYGDQEFTGAEQAVADINAKGGIKGNKLQIVKYDDACDPKQAVAVANKVVNDGIKYVIGHLCSSSTQPASDIYEDEGILMITPAATAPELTARSYQLILRTTGLDSDQGPTAAKYILEKVKPQRIAIVHDKQQYGEGLARAVQDVHGRRAAQVGDERVGADGGHEALLGSGLTAFRHSDSIGLWHYCQSDFFDGPGDAVSLPKRRRRATRYSIPRPSRRVGRYAPRTTACHDQPQNDHATAASTAAATIARLMRMT